MSPKESDGTVSVIATATNTVATDHGRRSPFGVAVTPDGSNVYVVNCSTIPCR